MNKPTKEQEQWVLERCGWKYKPDELCGDPRSPHIKHSYGWQPPDDYKWQSETPKLDLNNLFKYAVPKLAINDKVIISWSPVKGYRDYTAEIIQWSQIGNHKHTRWTEEENPALALFWTIYKVLGG